jgi:hypothetical protein
MPPMPSEGRPIPQNLHLKCISCGYDLTGLYERRCPECGEDFDPRETWRINEQLTWAHHFSEVRPISVYLGITAILGLILANILAIYFFPPGILFLPIIALGELVTLQTGGAPMRTRIIYLSWMLALIVGLDLIFW